MDKTVPLIKLRIGFDFHFILKIIMFYIILHRFESVYFSLGRMLSHFYQQRKVDFIPFPLVKQGRSKNTTTTIQSVVHLLSMYHVPLPGLSAGGVWMKQTECKLSFNLQSNGGIIINMFPKGI
jgi:hypothetical protein